MVCGKCNSNSLSTCKCPDIDKRMDNLKGSKYLALHFCILCGKHMERCTCTTPAYELSCNLKPSGWFD